MKRSELDMKRERERECNKLLNEPCPRRNVQIQNNFLELHTIVPGCDCPSNPFRRSRLQANYSTRLFRRLRKSQPPNSVIDTAPTTSNSLSISAASFSSTACSVLETTTTTSDTIPAISQDTTQTSKPHGKKRPPKNQSNTIKPKIENKTAPHRPRKPAPTEYSTDEEDMIVYDVDDDPELNPKCVISYKGEIVKERNGASIRYDFENPIEEPC
ncbi:hypothetical protein TNCV_2574501 [Trichonephila clavipes]|nr:hypothetical protein TNCV_2574501 [Trichonephila clavipes]